MWYSTAVAPAPGNIMTLPSLVTQIAGRSGCASFSPSGRPARRAIPAKPRGGDDPELGRIVAADLLRVDVDVDQFRGRDVVRVARHPRRAVDVGEAAAEREDHVGVPRGLRRRVLAPAAGDPEVERVPRRER